MKVRIVMRDGQPAAEIVEDDGTRRSAPVEFSRSTRALAEHPDRAGLTDEQKEQARREVEAEFAERRAQLATERERIESQLRQVAVEFAIDNAARQHGARRKVIAAHLRDRLRAEVRNDAPPIVYAVDEQGSEIWSREHQGQRMGADEYTAWLRTSDPEASAYFKNGHHVPQRWPLTKPDELFHRIARDLFGPR